jgi:hypothetical protein
MRKRAVPATRGALQNPNPVYIEAFKQEVGHLVKASEKSTFEIDWVWSFLNGERSCKKASRLFVVGMVIAKLP